MWLTTAAVRQAVAAAPLFSSSIQAWAVAWPFRWEVRTAVTSPNLVNALASSCVIGEISQVAVPAHAKGRLSRVVWRLLLLLRPRAQL